MTIYTIGMTVKHEESESTAVVASIYGESVGVKVVKGKGGYHKGDNALWLKSLCVEDLNAGRVKNGYDSDHPFNWAIIAEGSMPEGKGNAYIIDLKAI